MHQQRSLDLRTWGGMTQHQPGDGLAGPPPRSLIVANVGGGDERAVEDSHAAEREHHQEGCPHQQNEGQGALPLRAAASRSNHEEPVAGEIGQRYREHGAPDALEKLIARDEERAEKP